MNFDKPVADVSSPLAEVSGSGSTWTLSNLDYDGDLEAGTVFPLRFVIYYSGSSSPVIISMYLNNDDICVDDNNGHADTTTSDAGDTITQTEGEATTSTQSSARSGMAVGPQPKDISRYN